MRFDTGSILEQTTSAKHRVTPDGIDLALAEERERRRIARGLHDDVGQVLALIQGKLGALQASELLPRRAQEIDAVRILVCHAIKATRALTFELASPALYELGLEPALRSLGRQLQARHGIGFDLESDIDRDCAPDRSISVILYRCGRELLRNVADHAAATRVTMRLTMRRHAIAMSVADDGVGFEPSGDASGFSPGGGYGLYSMREQLRLLGGRFEIASAPGRGCKIVIAVPIAVSMRAAGADRGADHQDRYRTCSASA